MNTSTVHPYFVAKARKAFATVGGDPDRSGELARWAEDHKHDDAVQGVIVGQDGTILAQTWHDHLGGATYVRPDDCKRWGLRVHEMGLATGQLERLAGQPVVHIKRWMVCSGAGKHIRAV